MQQERKACPESNASSEPRRIRRFAARLAVAAVLIAAVAAGWSFLHREAEAGPAPKEIPPIPAMFTGWQKPDFVIVLSGQTHGYLQPCGCSYPQLGGLVRRYNFLEWLKTNKGWTVIPLEMGDIMAPKSQQPQQTEIKFEVNMKALETMGYVAYGLGETEIKADLTNTLAVFTAQQKNARPVPVTLNLQNAAGPGQPFFNLGVRQYIVVNAPKANVGVTSLVGPTFQKFAAGQGGVQFFQNGQIVPPGLVSLKADKAEFVVLLYQGTRKEAKAAAQFCNDEAKKNPKAAQVYIVVHPDEEEAPPGTMEPVLPANLVTTGHKGRYVGVVGVWKQPNGGFETKYELVAMGPEWTTPKAKEPGHPIMQLMEKEYAARVAKMNLAERYPRFDHITQLELKAKGGDAKFVGSDRCIDCHESAGQVWANTGHSHAFDTLVKDVNPGLRDKDGECIVCHSVGFMNTTGYLDRNNKGKTNDRLKHVGCEACHGPGSMHADNPNNKEFYKLINAFAPQHSDRPAKLVAQKLDDFCQKCHDIDNDVNWGKEPFLKKWERIAHPTPKGQAVQGKPKAGIDPPKIVEK